MRGKAVVFVSSKRYLKCVRTPRGWRVYYGGDPAFVRFVERLSKEEKVKLCRQLSRLIRKSIEKEIEHEIKRLRSLLEVRGFLR